MAEPPFQTSASPFALKLGTNYCPLDDELLQIRALLVEPLSRLKGLDGQIADLQKAMDKLTAERDTVEAFVAAHKALISPVRRLPLDIIQEIFVACLPTHRNCVMSATEAPVLLGRVCSSWRTISIATPRLWCRLHIVQPEDDHTWRRFKEKSEEEFVQRLESIKTWLSRSGQCPLSISLQGGRALPRLPAVAALREQSFMQAIRPLASRWTHLVVRVSSSVVEMLSSITESDVPLLQRLEITEFSAIEGGLGLFNAPNLTELTVAGRHWHATLVKVQDLPVRWANLAYLAVGYALPYRVVLELLGRCPQLQACSLRVESDLGIPADELGSVVEVPLLHSLDITGFAQGIQTMFRRLSLPELRRLDIRGEFVMDADVHTRLSIEDFLAFLAISHGLEGLRVETTMFTSSSLTQLLRGLPTSTTRLHIADRIHPWGPDYADGVVDDGVLAALTPTPDDPGGHGCPALQELQITRCLFPSDPAVVRFIEARMLVESPKPSTLKKVVIRYEREKQVDIAADIHVEPLLNSGQLELAIKYTSLPSQFPWMGLPDEPGVDQWEDNF
ncbi:hypothetical protein C8R46DRAFT_1004071 [Mycena filopes]|nr:hypothetical protein C8R46DRAFT_1004071 [Mycena filopes]